MTDTAATASLLKTPFYDFHVKQGARIVDFAGWAMPLMYRGIIAEHQHTRQAASIFDVSHMGRVKFSGKDAMRFLQHIITRNLQKAVVGQSLYSLVCNPAGGVLDDIIVSRFDDHWLMVCNASNRTKLLAWFEQHRPGFDVTIEDQTLETAMIALQGPQVIAKLEQALGEPISQIKRYHCKQLRYLFFNFTVFRSGYTGEDGVEIICGNKLAQMAMGFLAKSGKDPREQTLQPAGLGARDTLRIEAGMPLYGHELSESINPIAAGLGWAVADDKDFIGAAALAEVRRSGPAEKLVGLHIEGPRTPRADAAVLAAGQPVGRITSSCPSPTLNRTIAMAFVPAAHAAVGAALAVDLRGTPVAATVTPLPFYKRPA